MLDRSNGLDAHYYQPGIGTYVNTTNLSHTSRFTRFRSWYQKAKDSAVGTSFDSHVMGGYKFLMRCYQDDDIFLFGFSRGAYVARFLAEMLDHVGLLSNGNEEMAYFAWKAFAQWQERQEGTEEEKEKKGEMFNFLKAFRETFSRPVRRIRFMGLFDTGTELSEGHKTRYRFRRPSQIRFPQESTRRSIGGTDTFGGTQLGDRRTRKDWQRMRSLSPGADKADSGSIYTTGSQGSVAAPPEDEYELDEAEDQDIEELWFPGCHADLGGGWPLTDGEESALSHAPLVWMVREAQRAGLELDRDQMLALHCCDVDPRMLDATFHSTKTPSGPPVPTFTVTSPSAPNIFRSAPSGEQVPGWHAGLEPEPPKPSEFHNRLQYASAKGILHDCLEFNNGLPRGSVLSWKIMEYMPFRRMDLQADGTWKAITFPLPMGEVRDIPEDAKIHHSAIKRMEADENYRPGNLIVGGGGRGVRKAPKELGIGEWIVHKNKGDPVGEVLVRKGKSLDEEMKEEGK
ncbi:MAG: hypothetical protein Q9220_006859 [cf. Caloplaca sp. 1 TL-2023]